MVQYSFCPIYSHEPFKAVTVLKLKGVEIEWTDTVPRDASYRFAPVSLGAPVAQYVMHWAADLVVQGLSLA